MFACHKQFYENIYPGPIYYSSHDLYPNIITATYFCNFRFQANNKLNKNNGHN